MLERLERREMPEKKEVTGKRFEKYFSKTFQAFPASLASQAFHL